MAQSKTEAKQQKELEALAPKTVKSEKLTKHEWNDDIFVKEKQYKDEKGNVQVAKANWRKFNMSGVDIVAKKGEKVSEKDFNAFEKACGGDKKTLSVYISLSE